MIDQQAEKVRRLIDTIYDKTQMAQKADETNEKLKKMADELEKLTEKEKVESAKLKALTDEKKNMALKLTEQQTQELRKGYFTKDRGAPDTPCSELFYYLKKLNANPYCNLMDDIELPEKLKSFLSESEDHMVLQLKNLEAAISGGAEVRDFLISFSSWCL